VSGQSMTSNLGSVTVTTTWVYFIK
jgi:hypothetical protein